MCVSDMADATLDVQPNVPQRAQTTCLNNNVIFKRGVQDTGCATQCFPACTDNMFEQRCDYSDVAAVTLEIPTDASQRAQTTCLNEHVLFTRGRCDIG